MSSDTDQLAAARAAASARGTSGESPGRDALSAHLLAALETGADQLDPAASQIARAALDRASGRLRSGSSASVVALAGATGSGKSSLVNALAGLEVAAVGVRRPTTSAVTACVWGDVPEDLLDWLDVPRRHRTERVSELDADTQAPLEGLVLLDLPDHDSTHLDHRALVDRLVAQVDLMVWVADPQKYADAALHHGYLQALSGHSDVVLVVLNQVDTLPAPAVAACADDLRRLLVADGLDGVELLETSARTGAGVEDLRARLETVVAERTVAWRRSRADLAAATSTLRAGVGAGEPGLDDVEGVDALVDALAHAAGVPALVDAVRSSHERAGWARTGWPFTRWLRRLRPDPLRRLHLGAGGGSGRGSGGRGGASALGADGAAQAAALVSLQRTSLPAPTATSRAQVAATTRAVAASAGAHLPPRWGQAVRDAAAGAEEDVTDALDLALAGVPLDRRRPPWWAVVGVVQAVLALAVVVGALWLGGLAVLGWLQLPRPSTPHVGTRPLSLPLPTLLLVGGVLIGWALALVSGPLVRAGAARRGRDVRRRGREAVAEVATHVVLSRVEDVVVRHRRTREHLEAAARAAREDEGAGGVGGARAGGVGGRGAGGRGVGGRRAASGRRAAPGR